MAKLSKLKTDGAASVGGKWFEWEMGVRLLIARFGNPRHQAELERLAVNRAEAGLLEDDDDSRDAEQDDQRKAAAKCLLMDWENIEDDDGNPIPYSYETALEWLRDPDCNDLYNFVRTKSLGRSNFRKEAAAQGN